MRVLTNLLRAAILVVLSANLLAANTVSLTEGDLAQPVPSVLTAPGLVLPEIDPDLPILGPTATQDGARLLRLLNGNNAINGFAGILYDNRDRGHSTLDPDVFPRLTFLKYAANLAAKDLDFGLAGRILLPAVVLGNSSTAMTGAAFPPDTFAGLREQR